MVSCRILSCLFLTLLLQYGDAWNSRYMDSILTSLQRIEDMLVKQTEQNVLSCAIPCEKLFNVPSDNFLNAHDAHDEKTDEASSHRQLDMLKFRRAMSYSDEDSDDSPKRTKKQRQKNRNRNSNTNVNSNTNTNINSNKLRSFDFDKEYD